MEASFMESSGRRCATPIARIARGTSEDSDDDCSDHSHHASSHADRLEHSDERLVIAGSRSLDRRGARQSALHRAPEPEHRAPRRVEYKDPRAGKPTLSRAYLAPSYTTAKPGQAEALDILMKIIGSGATSRLYQRLVSEQKIASSLGSRLRASRMNWRPGA